MKKDELIKQIAHLESVNDQLMTEICYVDRLMRLIGFTGGITALKSTAQEFYERGDEYLDDIP
jgi:hypothetical protein